MKLNGSLALATMIVALAILSSGCGGISGSQTVSPLDFFMPGIIKNNSAPVTPTLMPPVACSNYLASAR